MKTMNKNDKDQKIYFACDRIRVFILMHAGGNLLKGNFKSESSKIIDNVHKGSIINFLINQHDWKTLFGNKDWLRFLERAQNLNTLENDFLTFQLKTIAEFFPKETKCYIFPEILV